MIGKWFFYLSIALFAPLVSQAESQKVFVQCDAAGPVYSGSVDFPSSINDWTLAQVGNESKYYCKLTSNQNLKIEFNGLTYSGHSNSVISDEQTYTGLSCVELLKTYGFSLFSNVQQQIEVKNQFGVSAETSLKPKDKFNFNLPKGLLFRTFDEYCFILPL